MVSLQAIWQEISKFLVGNKDLVRIWLTIGGLSISSLIGFIWWYRNQKRRRQFPPAIPSPFEIIRPNSDVLSIVFPGNKQDPLANASIRYQDRCPTRQVSVRRELSQKLSESDWLLIEGRTGLGKTREAGELAQLFNNEGWTVMWLKSGEWVDEPTSKHLSELNTNRKLLFLLDDLNQRMSFAATKEKSPRAENSPLEPIIEPLQNRLLRSLTTYEQFCNEKEMKVVATARNERFSDTPGKPSAWDKLEKDKYPKFWNRFTVYELPEPEDEAIAQLLRDTIPETEIYAKEENYLPIARKNDQTFRNVVENLVRLRNRKLPLTPNNYRDTLKQNWNRRYQDVVKRYPVAVHIYDAIDLLQQLGISLTREIVELTALLIMNRPSWQLWHRYSVGKALDFLVDAELVLTPRDGQIEARERTVELNKKYVRSLTKLVVGLTQKQPKSMLVSLYNLANNLDDYKYYQEALLCLNQLIAYLPENPEIYFVWGLRGNVFNNLQRYEEALASYDKALELNPDLDQAWYNRGIVIRKLQRYEEALASYDKALELNLDLYQAWSNRGIVLSNLKCYEEALASYDKALELNPDLDQAWYNQGIVLSNLKRYEEALVSYDKALELNPDLDQAWYNRGIALNDLQRYEEALASYDKALELNPDKDEAWYNRGNVLNDLQLYQEALASYDKALELNPDKDKAWNNRGNVLNDLQLYQEALASCNKTLELNPDDNQAWYNRGTVLNNLQRYQEALASYDKALELNPNLYQAWYNQGNVLSNLKRYQEALASYDKALELNPDKDEAWYNRGVVLDNLQRYKEEIASYDKALELNPDDNQAWYNRGIALNNLRRYKEALASYDKALELNPDDHQAWKNRGNVLNNLKLYEEALASYDKALELNPDLDQTWQNRGVTLVILESFEEAILSCEKALALKPDKAEAWCLKALIFCLQKNADLAVENLAQAIKLNPEYRKMAKTDSSFDNIREEAKFKALIEPE